MDFFKFFFRYLHKYKGKLSLYVLFTFLGSFFAVFSYSAIIPILNVLFHVSDKGVGLRTLADFSSLMDLYKIIGNNILYFLQCQIQVKGPQYVLLISCVFWMIMTILKNVFTYMASFFRAPIRHGIYRDMRADLFSKIICLPVGFFASAYKGDVMSRVTSDIIEVAAGIKKALNLLIKDAINVFVPVCVLLSISWKLTLVSMVFIPLFLWLLNRVSIIVQRLTLQAQNLMGLNVSLFDQMMNGLRIIKIFSAEETVKRHFLTQNDITKKKYIIRNRVSDLSYPLSEVLLTCIAAFLLYYGGIEVIGENSQLEGSVFIFFLAVLISTISPMTNIIDEFFSIRQSVACIQRLNFILKYNTQEDENLKGNLRKETILDIYFKNVSFSYDGYKYVLRDVSLNISNSKTYAIVGKTGAGKSTLMDILYKFQKPNNGKVLINQKNISLWDTGILRHSIAYVNQQDFLFNDTILYNLTFGETNLSILEIDDIAKKIGFDKILNSLPQGYNTNVGDSGICLSGGQRQMLSVFRALLRKPSVIILDEATSALDKNTEAILMEGIFKIMKNGTIIIISHNYHTIKYADKILVLDNGRFLAEDSDEVLSCCCSAYKEIFNI